MKQSLALPEIWGENNAALGSGKSGSKCSTPAIVQGALTVESLLKLR